MSILQLLGQEIRLTWLTLECIDNQIDLLLGIDDIDNTIVRFSNISMFSLKTISYPMCIQGFEVIDNKQKGWDSSIRYRVHDFEEECMNFYCQKIEEDRGTVLCLDEK